MRRGPQRIQIISRPPDNLIANATLRCPGHVFLTSRSFTIPGGLSGGRGRRVVRIQNPDSSANHTRECRGNNLDRVEEMLPSGDL